MSMPKEYIRGQTALEFIVTYSWAILIIAIFLGTVAIFSLSSNPPQGYLTSACYISPAFPCQQSAIGFNATNKIIQFALFFTNSLGNIIHFSSNSINLTTTGVGMSGSQRTFGNCTPSITLPGSEVVCLVNVPGTNVVLGYQSTAFFTVTYNSPCANSLLSSCSGSTYSSGGSALQTIGTQNFAYLKLSFNSNALLGYISLGGQAYANSVNSFFQSGNYNLYAVPPSGYTFSTWNVVTTGGGTSTLSSTSSQNTLLTLNGNAVITANFIP